MADPQQGLDAGGPAGGRAMSGAQGLGPKESEIAGPWHISADGNDIEDVNGCGVCAMYADERSGYKAAYIALAPEMYKVLAQMNHMGGDDRGGYCICPRGDGSALDEEHATCCKDARQLLARLDGGGHG